MDEHSTNGRKDPADTRQRILTAAAGEFAREGLQGATTRGIARQAGVREITLFRHFHSKENLLREVLAAMLEQQRREFEEEDAAAEDGDLVESLRRHIRQYEGVLTRNLSWIRALIGEIHRHGGQEREVIHGLLQPAQERLLALLEAAHRDGRIRAGVDPRIAGDLLRGMVFTTVLRRASACAPDDPPEVHLEACLDMFLHGTEVRS